MDDGQRPQIVPMIAVTSADVSEAPFYTVSEIRCAVASKDSFESSREGAVDILLPDKEQSCSDKAAFRITCISANGLKYNENSSLNHQENEVQQHVDDYRVSVSADDILSPSETLPSTSDYQSRFRVVKIDSSEPAMQRGRWMCLNFADSAAASLSLGRAADWLHDDVGYSSGSSVSSSGPIGCQNPLLFLCDNDSSIGLSVDVSRPNCDSMHPVSQRLSSSDLFPEHKPLYSPGVAWLDCNNECIVNVAAFNSPLCIRTQMSGSSNVEDLGECDDSNENGASAVAIDNKIEQAMDLVKSHLMFAVREEVEILKEQIKLLMERNNQLEHENSILRAAALPETLAVLNSKQSPTT